MAMGSSYSYRGRGRGDLNREHFRRMDRDMEERNMMEDRSIVDRDIEDRNIEIGELGDVSRQEERNRRETIALRLGISPNFVSRLSMYSRTEIDINRIIVPPLRSLGRLRRLGVEEFLDRHGVSNQGRIRYGMTVTDIRRHHRHNSYPVFSHNFDRVAAGLDIPLSSRLPRVMDVLPLLNDMAQEEANRDGREQNYDDGDQPMDYEDQELAFPRGPFPAYRL